MVSQLFADAQVTVNINNLNEAPKFDPADNKRKISENSATARHLSAAQFEPVMRIRTQEASLEYSIQTAGTPFSIDPVTGVLSVNGVINFEAKKHGQSRYVQLTTVYSSVQTVPSSNRVWETGRNRHRDRGAGRKRAAFLQKCASRR